MNRTLILSIVACVGCAVTAESWAQTVVSSPAQSSQASAKIDYANAKPVPGRIVSTAPTSQIDATALKQLLSSPGFVPGADATGSIAGKFSPAQLAPAKELTTGLAPQAVAPQQYGTSGHAFSTVRVNAYLDKVHTDPTQYFYPFRAVGKLFFVDGSTSYVCSASLIRPGVIVTAAHCVAAYGQNRWYSGWSFVPAYYNGTAPYGTFSGRVAYVLTKYLDGTDNCISGVVCPDDVALIVLNRNVQGSLPGGITGYLGYGYGGYGFNPSGQALITQIGYPVALDGGVIAQRSDSQSYVSASNRNNNVIGSLQTGGSSGGPWAVNLGQSPILNGTALGAYAAPNTVVGVTSWGYTDVKVKEQGASPFTTANIATLMSSACAANTGYC